MAEIIVVHGYAGSGKSTQCSRLEREGYFGSPVQHISAGNRLRSIRTGLATSTYEPIINSPNAPSPLPDKVVSGAILESILDQENDNGIVLIDGYPRHPTAVEAFRDELANHSHRLLGTIALQVSLETSVQRILERGERAGEKIKANTLQEFAVQRYKLDRNTTNIAINTLADFAPVEIVDSSYERDAVYESFRKSIANLLAFSH